MDIHIRDLRYFVAVAEELSFTRTAGNAQIYQREDVSCRPVTGLSPSELAVVWRTADHREAVRDFIDACCLCTAARRTPVLRDGAGNAESGPREADAAPVTAVAPAR